MSKQIGVKRKRVLYSPNKMATAIQMVRSGSMSQLKAAKTYGVPRTTLIDKLAGRVPEEATRPGPQSILSREEEKTLVNYIFLMAEIGYPLTKREFLLEVKRILDLDGRPTPFNDNLPGKDWYSAFRKRNPEVSARMPQSLGHERAAINSSMIDNWYSKMRDYLKKEVPDWEEMVSDPRRIFNADESGFPLCVKSDKVLAPTGAKHVYQVVPSDKTQITVMACMNAMGQYMPPMILYPGERFRDVGIAKFPEAIFAHTPNGWMDSNAFLSFLEYFHKFTTEKRIPTPVMLIVDGHSTHINLEASKFCRDHQIVLYCLLPNATHILQACDVGLFSPMKSAWQKHVKNWQMQNIGNVLTKRTFPEVFRGTWYEVANFTNAVKGFQRSGLFPLDPKGIDSSKLGPSREKDQISITVDSVDATGDNVAIPPSTSKVILESGDTEPCMFNFCAPINVVDIDDENEDINVEDEPFLNIITNANNRKDSEVSSAFEQLKVPEPKTMKKSSNQLRQKLPKALSGTEAIAMLEQREQQKKEEEENKKKRKELRLQKRKEKEEEREKKRMERERKKREKEENKKRNVRSKKQKTTSKAKQKKVLEVVSSSSESEKENITYMDSSSPADDSDSDFCYTCGGDEGSPSKWVGCQKCSNWFHVRCCGVDGLESSKNCVCYMCKK